jgi:hypothetical protein
VRSQQRFLASAKRSALLAALAIAATAAFAPAAEAAPAPAWTLSLTPMPANFAPGEVSQYLAVATNVGGGVTTGEPTRLETSMPAGVVPIGVNGHNSDPGSNPDIACAIAAQTVSCETSGSVHPGQMLRYQMQVEVPPGTEEGPVEAKSSVSGGGAAQQVSTSASSEISPDPLPFQILPGFTAPLTNEDGSAATAAGSHPYQFTTDFSFPSQVAGIQLTGAGHPRDIYSELPRGLLGNPAATPVLCTELELTTGECPDPSQIGILSITTVTGAISTIGPGTSPVYNMVPPAGSVASFGTSVANVGYFIHILGGVRTDGDYGLEGVGRDTVAPPGNPIFHVEAQLWGDPSSAAHDQIRGKCLEVNTSCPVAAQKTSFLTMPSECSGKPLPFEVRANSWEEPGVFKSAQYESSDPEGNPASVSGCNQLEFKPTIEAQPSTNLAESPSGLDADLHQPQNLDLEGHSTAALKDISVALPEGMTLNPSAADGLQGCSSAQVEMITAVGQSPSHFDKSLPQCPDASKIGTVEVSSPALAKRDAEHKLELDPETGEPIPVPLEGSVYLAKPFDNPFGSLLAIYLAIEDQEKTGIVAKLPGKITADPNTGQLVTTFSDGPELPIEDVRLHIFGGARSPLITPPLCGNHTISAKATPWSTPEGADVTAIDTFATSAFPGGGSCPTSAGAAPNSPSFSAGTLAPQAGAYSPFVLKLLRGDGSQRLSGVDATLPPGLIGKLAGLGQCTEAQIASAKAREAPNMGALELASPSCPTSSQLGTVDVSAGAGPTPLHVGAKAYLTGPYKGAPIGIAVITPAIAGPFDLGTVVTRIALYINAESAQVHAVTDPFPKLLEGIPLDVRGASLKLDRPNFTLNPTSCEPMAINGNAATFAGGLASLRSPFQVGGCSSLGFKPNLDLRLIGGTKRGGHPALKATYKPRPGDANIKSLVVRLPRSAFLDQAHIRTICTRVQFAADSCPAAAQYGSVKAWTPLLENPLEGPVWLRSSNHKLPDLVFDLHGQIDVEVATRIDSVNGGIRARIESAPDAPLTKVILHMQGQKKGLIINSRDICQGSNRADVEMEGQNGKVADSKPQLKAKCGKSRKGKGHKHGKGGA